MTNDHRCAYTELENATWAAIDAAERFGKAIIAAHPVPPLSEDERT